jgi:asparagine synthase (glutamine-hydrolysing)
VWAFCFSDEKYVYLVRDRFGEKPLYYTIFKNHLCFCSEVKGMLDIPGLNLEIDLPELYPHLETAISGKTIFKNVFEVLPGSCMIFDKRSGTIRQHQYYSLPDIAKKDRQSFDVKQLSSLIVDAVKLRIPDISYSAYVSGGIDSSAIAQILTPDQVLTCTAQMPGISEEKYADMVVACRGGIDYAKVSGNHSIRDFIEMVYANDGPTTTLAAISEFLLAQRVRHKVVFSGIGVDEFFGGYARHVIACSNILPKEIHNQYQYLVSKVGNLYLRSAQKYYRLVNRSSHHSLFERIFEDIFSVIREPVSAMGVCDAVVSLVPLLSTSDKMNMWSGVEMRSPFLDYRIVEYGLSLRMHDKIRRVEDGILTKYAFREAVRDFLPREIYERRDKVGFSSDINKKLSEEWKPLVEKLVSLQKQEYPKNSYYELSPTFEIFDRKIYQIFQLGITHLLFCRKLTIDDVLDFMVQ